MEKAEMKCPKCGYEIPAGIMAAEMGRKGGSKSRRTLTPEQARKMVEARERKKRKEGAHGNKVKRGK
jgi:hypothetical protein